MDRNDFLAITAKDLKNKGIETPDFVLVSGDAYVDHPSFANAIVGRYLEFLGYSVGLIPQPSYNDPNWPKRFGKPRLAFLVSAGNMDSMVNLYTANKAPRKSDAYSPGGKKMRPARATGVYAKMIRKAYPDVPIIAGGVEASLRRLAHYDYWDDTVMPSILVNTDIDLLIYGMGENPLREIAEALDSGMDVAHITYVRGTAYIAKRAEDIYEEKVELPSFEEVSKNKRKYAEAFKMAYDEADYAVGKTVLQKHGDCYVVQNPPAEPLTQQQMDDVYSMPFTKMAHPAYKEHIAALDEVQFSITSSRGCFGGCNFCAIYSHQGRYIQRRSKKSIVEEAEKLTQMPNFKGNIHDVGGPTANFLHQPCKKKVMCKNKRCLAPTVCSNLRADHTEYIDILRAVRAVKGVKRVFIRSGIRYDYVMADRSGEFISELAKHHVSGQLKVAPEHASKAVLNAMGKPGIELYEKFKNKFEKASRQAGKKQYVLPYFIASHPGCTLNDAIELAVYLKKQGFIPDQVQDFYPTPGSASTCMYYTGLDPFTMKKVYVPKRKEERAMQRALLQFNKPENYALVKKALRVAGRLDLIGGKNGLIRG